VSHPFKKEADKSKSAKMKRFADGGDVMIKDQSRYGDAAADVRDNSRPNEWGARMLLGPPRTKNTPGFDTETSSTRRKKG